MGALDILRVTQHQVGLERVVGVVGAGRRCVLVQHRALGGRTVTLDQLAALGDHPTQVVLQVGYGRCQHHLLHTVVVLTQQVLADGGTLVQAQVGGDATLLAIAVQLLHTVLQQQQRINA